MIGVGGGLCLLLITTLALGAIALRPRSSAVAGVATPAPILRKVVPLAAVAAPVDNARGAAKPAPADVDGVAVKSADQRGDTPNGTVKAFIVEVQPQPVEVAEKAAPEVKAEQAPPSVLAAQPDPGAAAPGGTCGTSIAFLSSPRLAARHAVEEEKLLFTLHVSGNFEDPGFT
jgi:hypothetical protein